MKKIFFTVLCFVLLNKVSAQADKVALDNVFQHIDKSTIPTGYLQDYGVAMINKEAYKGILVDSNAIRRWWCSSPTTPQSVAVGLAVKRIENPVLSVIRHALRNMWNS